MIPTAITAGAQVTWTPHIPGTDIYMAPVDALVLHTTAVRARIQVRTHRGDLAERTVALSSLRCKEG